MIRAALIRMLWRAVADGDECDCSMPHHHDDCPDTPEAPCRHEDTTDVCQAVRALGYGEHWDPVVFQRRAIAERLPCEFCKQVADRVRCQGCYRDLCERCLARPNCDHAHNGLHQEASA